MKYDRNVIGRRKMRHIRVGSRGKGDEGPRAGERGWKDERDARPLCANLYGSLTGTPSHGKSLGLKAKQAGVCSALAILDSGRFS